MADFIDCALSVIAALGMMVMLAAAACIAFCTIFQIFTLTLHKIKSWLRS